MRSPARPAQVTGYTLDLGGGLCADLHADGALSLVAGDGRSAELAPHQVERLAELLALGGGLRSSARRRRARATYTARWGEGEA